MSKHRKRVKKPRPPVRTASGSGLARREERVRGRRKAGAGATGLAGKRPILRFVLLFVVWMGVFYGITALSWFEHHAWVPYLSVNARASAAILQVIGQPVTVAGRSIMSPTASLSIERGCDAIHPSALFAAGILALPVPVRRKLCGLVIGITFLMAANLVRIITLFFVMKYYPTAFEVAHVEVWQVLFILLAVLTWVVWAWWATARAAAQPNATTS